VVFTYIIHIDTFVTRKSGQVAHLSGSVSEEKLQSFCSELRCFVLQRQTVSSFSSCSSSRYAELQYTRLSGVLHSSAF